MDTSEDSQQVILAEPVAQNTMETGGDQQVQLYDHPSAPLILDPNSTIISSNHNDSEVVTTSTMSAGGHVPTSGAFSLGSQVYIIQSHQTQSVDTGLDFVVPSSAAVSVADMPSVSVSDMPVAEGEVLSAAVEQEVVEGVDGLADDGYITQQREAVVDAGSDSATYHSLAAAEDGVTGVLPAGELGSGEQGETITLSLEEATQLFLQPGLEGAAIQMSDGSFQLLGQQFIQVSREDGRVEGQVPVEVLQTLGGSMMTYSGLDTPHPQSDHTHTGLHAPQGVTEETTAESTVNCQETAQAVTSNVITIDMSSATPVAASPEGDGTSLVTEPDSISAGTQLASSTEGASLKVSVTDSGSTVAVLETLPQGVEVKKEAETAAKPPEPKPDLNCPIEVTERTEIVIKGKKCLLMRNPDTKQLCAYPILPPQGKKRRGRPRKIQPAKMDGDMPDKPSQHATPGSSMAPPLLPVQGETTPQGDKDMTAVVMSAETPGDYNSAAQGLLELSNTGPDNVRRSARKRKKAKVLEDYDVLDASSEEEGGFNDDNDKDPDVTMYGVKRHKVKRDAVPLTTSPFMMPVKRGRGRPRRYPLPGQSSASSIPAVILPSGNGQTLVMAPLQGLQNLPGLQSQVKAQLQQLIPKTSVSSSGESPLPAPPSTATTTATTVSTAALGPDGDALPLNPAVPGLESSALLSGGITTETVPLGGESSDTQEGLDGSGEKERGEGEGGSSGGEGQQHTVIQIPDNLLPIFGLKKDTSPIKIGLKASESELEKLKCPKCDFQAYYVQQYQHHIATHAADIHKCKCCNYLTFDKDDLLQHFKETHPRCICNVCDFMAEHAYMIKRHMMRHNAEGCTCDVCGKVYKDQYILKMHVKMVHMPAEVLFECTVCGKKFTRKAHLKRHLRIHEPEKPYKCPHCDYRGCERSDISKHLLIHEEPKHVCEVCQKAFRHIKNKELHVKRHNGQRDYKCGVCDFYGYTFTDIRKHIERKHADIKTVACDKCSMHFKSEVQLREHQKDCDVLMIERALAIHTSSGGSSQATIQIPSSFAVDGQQITIDGQQIAVDGGHLNITVEHVSEEDVSLEDQMVETTIGDIVTSSGDVIENTETTISDMVTASADVIESTEQAVMAEGAVHIISSTDMGEEEDDLSHDAMVSLE